MSAQDEQEMKTMARAQAVNPFLPSWEYVPDGEPRVFGDRLYLFGSHDRFAGRKYCMNDYVAWSAPLEDLTNWTSHGVAYRKEQDPGNRKGRYAMWAPDVVQGGDGRFYLFYGLEFVPRLAVAVAHAPAGPYEFHGYVQHPDGALLGRRPGDAFPFDPGVLVDDDGRIFVYFGFAPTKAVVAFQIDRHKLRHEGAYVVELRPDMRTVASSPTLVAPMAGAAHGTSFEGHEYYEAASIRRIDDEYYLVYSSIHGHELCYATSPYPDRDFAFQGVLVSNGDIGLDGRRAGDALNYWANNHGGLVKVGDRWFVFHHRHTNREQVSRQSVAEPITRSMDGRFHQAEMTSSGLNDGPLVGVGTYSARIACVLRSSEEAEKTPYKSLRRRGRHPFFTQTGRDRESFGDQHIANMRDGAVAGFKYLDLSSTRAIGLATRGATGTFLVSTQLDGEIIAEVPVHRARQTSALIPLPAGLDDCSAMYLCYRGEGAADLLSFTLAREIG